MSGKARAAIAREARKLQVRHTASGHCAVCTHKEAAEICEAYIRWVPNLAICAQYDISESYLRAHAYAYHWDKQRVEKVDPLYHRLMNDVMGFFRPEKLQARDAGQMLVKLAFQMAKLQGRIVDHHEVDAHKSVTFIHVPLPGGSRAESMSGAVIEGKFLPGGGDATDEVARGGPAGVRGESGGGGSRADETVESPSTTAADEILAKRRTLGPDAY